MAGDEASRPETAELEQLADKLSERDIKTILAPGPDGAYCLEVINLHPAGVHATRTAGRVWYRNGSFWWAGLEEVPGSGDLARAIDFVCTALRWSRELLTSPQPHGEGAGLTAPAAPDDT